MTGPFFLHRPQTSSTLSRQNTNSVKTPSSPPAASAGPPTPSGSPNTTPPPADASPSSPPRASGIDIKDNKSEREQLLDALKQLEGI